MIAIKKIALGAACALIALSAFSCKAGSPFSEKDRAKRIGFVSGYLTKELKLDAAQRRTLEESLHSAANRLLEAPRPDKTDLDAFRAAFVSGGAEFDRALEWAKAKRRSGTAREELALALESDAKSFFAVLDESQRAALFDLLAEHLRP